MTCRSKLPLFNEGCSSCSCQRGEGWVEDAMLVHSQKSEPVIQPPWLGFMVQLVEMRGNPQVRKMDFCEGFRMREWTVRLGCLISLILTAVWNWHQQNPESEFFSPFSPNKVRTALVEFLKQPKFEQGLGWLDYYYSLWTLSVWGKSLSITAEIFTYKYAMS